MDTNELSRLISGKLYEIDQIQPQQQPRLVAEAITTAVIALLTEVKGLREDLKNRDK